MTPDEAYVYKWNGRNWTDAGFFGDYPSYFQIIYKNIGNDGLVVQITDDSSKFSRSKDKLNKWFRLINEPITPEFLYFPEPERSADVEILATLYDEFNNSATLFKWENDSWIVLELEGNTFQTVIEYVQGHRCWMIGIYDKMPIPAPFEPLLKERARIGTPPPDYSKYL